MSKYFHNMQVLGKLFIVSDLTLFQTFISGKSSSIHSNYFKKTLQDIYELLPFPATLMLAIANWALIAALLDISRSIKKESSTKF